MSNRKYHMQTLIVTRNGELDESYYKSLKRHAQRHYATQALKTAVRACMRLTGRFVLIVWCRVYDDIHDTDYFHMYFGRTEQVREVARARNELGQFV